VVSQRESARNRGGSKVVSRCVWCRSSFLWVYQWWRSHTGWPHAAQSGKSNCQGPEASFDSEIPLTPHTSC
jgi:hypothetical protein